MTGIKKPKDPTAAERKRRQRERQSKMGLERVEVYVPNGRASDIQNIAQHMRDEHDARNTGQAVETIEVLVPVGRAQDVREIARRMREESIDDKK